VIVIGCSHKSNRLEYIVDVIFKYILNVEYRLIEADPNNEINLGYYQEPSDELISIPASGILHQTTTHVSVKREFNILAEKYQHDAPILSYDVLALAFLIAAEYDAYLLTDFDKFDRYETRERWVVTSKLIEEPVLDKIAFAIANLLKLPIKKKYDYQITVDVDYPYQFKELNWVLKLGKIAKKSPTTDFLIKNIRSAFTSYKDPYDTYEDFFSQVPKDKLLFFLLTTNKGSKNSRHSLRNVVYRDLIQSFVNEDIDVGLHPSYDSYKNFSTIENELKSLSLILGYKVEKLRMHYLQYRLPLTRQYFIDSGILQDFTTLNPHINGFLLGTSYDIPWYNIEQEITTNLMLYPTMAMDRVFQHYQKLNQEETLNELKKLVQQTKKFGGTFRLLMHNDTLSNREDWREWKSTWIEVFNFIKTELTLGN
jgi:hypothetical protein